MQHSGKVQVPQVQSLSECTWLLCATAPLLQWCIKVALERRQKKRREKIKYITVKRQLIKIRLRYSTLVVLEPCFYSFANQDDQLSTELQKKKKKKNQPQLFMHKKNDQSVKSRHRLKECVSWS